MNEAAHLEAAADAIHRAIAPLVDIANKREKTLARDAARLVCRHGARDVKRIAEAIAELTGEELYAVKNRLDTFVIPNFLPAQDAEMEAKELDAATVAVARAKFAANAGAEVGHLTTEAAECIVAELTEAHRALQHVRDIRKESAND